MDEQQADNLVQAIKDGQIPGWMGPAQAIPRVNYSERVVTAWTTSDRPEHMPQERVLWSDPRLGDEEQ